MENSLLGVASQDESTYKRNQSAQPRELPATFKFYQPHIKHQWHTAALSVCTPLNHIILLETNAGVLNLTSALTGDSDIKSC